MCVHNIAVAIDIFDLVADHVDKKLITTFWRNYCDMDMYLEKTSFLQQIVSLLMSKRIQIQTVLLKVNLICSLYSLVTKQIKFHLIIFTDILVFIDAVIIS